MAVYSQSDRKKIILLLLFIIVLIIAGLIIIDFTASILGVYLPLPGLDIIKSVSLKKKIKQSENPYLLEREELAKEKERLLLVEEKLINREKEISEKEISADKKLELLKEKEKEIEKKRELLEYREKQTMDREKNIREQAVKLYNMPPNDAVVILEKQTEEDIVDILRAIDSYSEELGRVSTSPYLLKLLNDKNQQKAANVLRKFQYTSPEKKTSVEQLEENELP
ncbi:MAG TPA: hypothetical protein PLE45_01420 [Spirochaetota bacterium]|nr:hypothetical protein [Spirochaetota bacterium]HOL56314.1 hypothetical protein [Spirochaetota bacterium]HPP03341.1 hypothetical protein [Spirochaetota bacterium]